mgnify:CR=1 FL=1
MNALAGAIAKESFNGAEDIDVSEGERIQLFPCIKFNQKLVIKDPLTITYVSEFGDVPEPSVLPNPSYIPIPDISYFGYTFLGWYSGDTKIEGGLATGNMTLTAKWAEVTINIVTIELPVYNDITITYTKTGNSYLFTASPASASTYEWYIDDTVQEGSTTNTVHFSLAPKTKQFYAEKAPGTIRVTFNFPANTNTVAAKIGFFGFGTPSTKYLVKNGKITYEYTVNFSSSQESTPLLKMYCYADEECTLLTNVFTEYVKVLEGRTSTATRTIENENKIYTVTLVDSQNGTNKSYKYTRFSDDITLPTDIRKSGYSFMGWYTDSLFSGRPVTSISVSQAKDLTLYAKWQEGCYIYPLYAENALDSFSDRTELEVHLLESEELGTWASIDNILSQLINYSLTITQVKLDLSETTLTTYFGYKQPENLTEVVFPSTLTSISSFAFGYCTALQSVTIPRSVKEIYSEAFYKCTNLWLINFEDKGSTWQYSKDSSETFTVPENGNVWRAYLTFSDHDYKDRSGYWTKISN